LLATVDIVTQKEVVCLGWKPAILEETEQVVVLAMDVTADLWWGRKVSNTDTGSDE
jgi:hypothetical protein